MFTLVTKLTRSEIWVAVELALGTLPFPDEPDWGAIIRKDPHAPIPADLARHYKNLEYKNAVRELMRSMGHNVESDVQSFVQKFRDRYKSREEE